VLPRHSPFLAATLCALVACEGRRDLAAEQLGLFPGSAIVHDLEPASPSLGRGLPECLRAPAAVIGRGVCVPDAVARSDGARSARKWGTWTYEYVSTTQSTSSTGERTTHFRDLEETRLGLESQGAYEANVFTGTWTFWHPNGKKRAIGGFVGGEMSGDWEFWLADGLVDIANTGRYEHGAHVSESSLPH
jgi:hypothetical protein